MRPFFFEINEYKNSRNEDQNSKIKILILIELMHSLFFSYKL